MTTMAHLDAQVARIVDAVEDAGLTARTTFFVVSDHGFKTVKRHIRPNTAFEQAGLLTVTDGKVASADAYSVPEGGTALVYVTVPDPSGAILRAYEDRACRHRGHRARRGAFGVRRARAPVARKRATRWVRSF